MKKSNSFAIGSHVHSHLLLEHARRMFSITARQPVTLQQQEAARKAIERAKSCLKLPKTHIDTDKRAFYPAKQTYSEWLKSWEIWRYVLHFVTSTHYNLHVSMFFQQILLGQIGNGCGRRWKIVSRVV